MQLLDMDRMFVFLYNGLILEKEMFSLAKKRRKKITVSPDLFVTHRVWSQRMATAGEPPSSASPVALWRRKRAAIRRHQDGLGRDGARTQ